MKLFSKYVDYFFTGVGFGSICYLCILTFMYPGVAPTVKGVSSVFLLSGLIGIWSMIFKTDLSLISAIIIHFIGTFIIFLVMAYINAWRISWISIFIFVLAYIVIWIIIFLGQKKTISKINIKIKQRNLNRK
ncbi:DUF3021 domain-containing protein [Lactobacillus agrestimuris]|uniref:DUF3021 domain-containing protein n=1 Tax=Lactobacillus agrestimuris TaxID=2941328 RepID=UPI00204321B1|nr:DUF3021 domain-containing protein [Lactobacillus agrestimuris]